MFGGAPDNDAPDTIQPPTNEELIEEAGMLGLIVPESSEA